jgi:hypothetical protein
MVIILKILFYLAIGIPFIYMIADVFYFIICRSVQLYSVKVKPLLVLTATSLLKH